MKGKFVAQLGNQFCQGSVVSLVCRRAESQRVGWGGGTWGVFLPVQGLGVCRWFGGLVVWSKPLGGGRLMYPIPPGADRCVWVPLCRGLGVCLPVQVGRLRVVLRVGRLGSPVQGFAFWFPCAQLGVGACRCVKGGRLVGG